MTFLALDIGAKRIGAAVGDSDMRIASGVAVISRHAALRLDAEEITRLAVRYAVDRIVIGVPREMDGTIGAQAEIVLDYAGQLKHLVHLPFLYQDERFSTSAALALRREAGVSEKRGRPTIDAAAAAVILQDMLDSLPRKGEPYFTDTGTAE